MNCEHKKTRCRAGSSGHFSFRQSFRRYDLPGEVVFPFVVVQIAAVPFDFAALRIDGIGTERIFARNEFRGEIVVEGDAEIVEAAEIKPLQRRIRGIEAAVGDIHRNPSVRSEVDLGPVVDVFVVAGGERPARLPTRRDAVHAHERDQQHGLFAAIAVAGIQRVRAQVRDGGILARAGPRDFIDGGKNALRDLIRIGGIADHLARKDVQRLGEYDMRRALGHIRLKFRRDFRRIPLSRRRWRDTGSRSSTHT